MSTTRTPRQEQLLDELVTLFLEEGFREFTLTDLATRLRCSKSTLYALGQTKEQVTVNAVRHFFRSATDQVEHEVVREQAAGERIVTYLRAIGDALRPASPKFMTDLAATASAQEVYERNTTAAAKRVNDLVAQGVAAGDFREVHAAFVADTVAATMQRIQTGAVLRATGLHDADAYDELAALVLDGIRSG